MAQEYQMHEVQRHVQSDVDENFWSNIPPNILSNIPPNIQPTPKGSVQFVTLVTDWTPPVVHADLAPV